MSNIRYCKRCGNPLAQKSRFCDNCGAPVEIPAETGQSGRGQRPANSDPKARQSRNSGSGQARRSVQQERNTRQSQQPNGQNPNMRQRQASAEQNLTMRQRQQMPAGQNPNTRQCQQVSGQNPNMRQNQRPNGQNPNRRPVSSYEEEQRSARYRQQEMEKDWQQSWDRTHDEEEVTGFTPLQYVLIGLMVILLVALIVFCAFWIFGRSDKKSDTQRNSAQNAAVTTEQMQDQSADAIEILDGGGMQVQTEAQTVKQTESETQTEKQTEPQQIIEIQENPNQQVQVQESTNQQAEAQQTSAGGGYLAESSSRALTDADVAGMSSEDMQMAINEIYARHGRKFSSESIQSYFDSQSWYSGTVAPEEFSESVFSATEAQNIQFLLNKMGAQ